MIGVWSFSEVTETTKNMFENSALGKLATGKNFDKPAAEYDKPLAKECENLLLSTYKERLNQVPLEGERGHWTGERGESTYKPASDEIKTLLEKYNIEGIDYKNCIPDFAPVSEATVQIDNMSESRPDNFKQCDKLCAEKWNQEGYAGKTDWTSRDIADWRRDNNYTWHERNDMTTCDLVPMNINDYFGHLGGVSECKKLNAGGNIFDE